MDTTLVILAAGIGSRFGGGVKQLTPVGPSGELIIDYSIHDALEAGFKKVVFIIRKDLDEDFRKIIGSRIEKLADVSYAYQELTDLPDGFSVPQGRTKPWGTGQALLAAKEFIHEPFAVVNADDYYGKEGFVKLYRHLTEDKSPSISGRQDICMTAFILGNTLSDNGGVTRGICVQDKDGHLVGINETKNIIKTDSGNGAAVMTDDGLEEIDPASLVSMNMWGFTPAFLHTLEESFPKFLSGLGGTSSKSAEFLLPIIVDGMIKNGEADVTVLKSNDRWFGVTYQEDKDSVKEEFAKLIAKGAYKTPLFQ